MNKGRIKAFTIMEVTVVLLIASIAIGITYTVYTIVVRSYTSYKVKNDTMAGILRLDELLKKDFLTADIILKSQKGIVLKNAGRPVGYEIEPGFVVRISSITDTFKFSIREVNTLFENRPVTEEEDRIDELQLTLRYEDKKIPYTYHKLYSAVNLVQKNTDAVH